MRHLARWHAAFWVIVLGAWGGIVSYAGPWFGYRFGADAGWHWTTAQWELHLAPGAAAVLGGLLLLSYSRLGVRIGGYLAAAAGMWFVVGPLFASMWLGPVETRVASATLRQVAGPLGYHYGTGLLIVALAAYALGRALPVLVAQAYPARGVHARPVREVEQPATATQTQVIGE